MFVSVSVIGQRAIGLRVQTIVKDSGQILELMEKIKAIDGIRLAVWSEIVDTPENKMSVPSLHYRSIASFKMII
jgi:hypothetical protein